MMNDEKKLNRNEKLRRQNGKKRMKKKLKNEKKQVKRTTLDRKVENRLKYVTDSKGNFRQQFSLLDKASFKSAVLRHARHR